MPRARWLKPEFFKDRKMGKLGPVAALVYEALWVTADDGGMARCDPEQLKGEWFYFWRDVGVAEIQSALRDLHTLGRVKFYSGGDELFCQVVRWKRHQQVHNPSAFRYRDHYRKQDKDFTEVLPQWCGSPAAGLPPSSPPRLLDSKTPSLGASRPEIPAEPLATELPLVVEPESGPESASEGSLVDERTKYPEEFERVWAAYPKRDGGNSKRAAFKAWRARVRSGVSPDEMLAGVERYRGHCEARGKVGTEFVQQAATFFGPGEHFREPWTLPATAAGATRGGNGKSGLLTPAELEAYERQVSRG